MASRYKWTVEEETFIVKSYHQFGSTAHTQVKRAMRKEFGHTWKLVKTKPAHLYRVFERFQKQGKFTASFVGLFCMI